MTSLMALPVKLERPALSIQALYPLSSLSICCCRRSFMKALRFSTRSLSLANSLQERTKSTDTYFDSSEFGRGALSYITLYLGGSRWIKKSLCGSSRCSVDHGSRAEEVRQRGSRLVQCADNDNQSPLLTSPCRTNYLEPTLTPDGGAERLDLATSNKVSRKAEKFASCCACCTVARAVDVCI